MTADNQKRSRCTPEADLELVRRYQGGDEEAVTVLLDVHHPMIKYWVGRVVGIASWANPDDILQEARLGFSQAAKTFDFLGKDDFHSEARTYARRRMFESRELRIVNRTLYENYRDVIKAQDRLMEKLNRRPTVEELGTATGLSVNQVETALNVIAAFPFPLEDEAHGNLTTEDSHYESQLARDAIQQLQPDHAEIIIRYYFYGQTDREIATDLGSSTEAIKEKRQRTLKKLRDIISGKGV